MSIRCDGCGHFVAYQDISSGKAVQRFTPETDLTFERVETFCPSCTKTLPPDSGYRTMEKIP